MRKGEEFVQREVRSRTRARTRLDTAAVLAVFAAGVSRWRRARMAGAVTAQ